MDWLLNPKPKRDHPKWADLDTDCLINVFERVGMESLILFIPFVCKSWYKASTTPSCWKQLIFPDPKKGTEFDPWACSDISADGNSTSEDARFDYFIRKYAREFGINWRRFTIPKFIKFAIDRSEGGAEFLKLPRLCSHYTQAVAAILGNISKSCNSFRALHVCDAPIGESEAAAIVDLAPNLRQLWLRRATIRRENLVTILNGCKELEVLDVRDCSGFSEADEEIIRLAAHIPQFACDGSVGNDPQVLFHYMNILNAVNEDEIDEGFIDDDYVEWNEIVEDENVEDD